MKKTAPTAGPPGSYLRIGDLARLVGISPTMLRSWEKLGVARPLRTSSAYRLYSAEDVKLFKRIKYLRQVRGLNAKAIIEQLKGEGFSKNGMPSPANRIGLQLRRLRLRKKLSLSKVALRVGISTGFLSALERGHMSASVGTLRRLARVYRSNILDLFEASKDNPRRVRPAERKSLEAAPGIRMELLAWGNTVMEPHLFRIASGAESGESYSHQGEEFLFLLKGRLQISVDGAESTLFAGDSFYFESSIPHRWMNPGKTETVLLWVNTPPTF